MKKFLLLFYSLFCWGMLIVNAQAPLNGTYTIGGASPNYATFTAAVNDLKAKGVSAPVVFNVRTGAYNERFAIPEITGSSKENTITFQAESGKRADVTVASEGGNLANDHHVIRLDGADHIILKNLTIHNLSHGFASAIHLTKQADYNLITGCHMVIDSIKTETLRRVAGIILSGEGTATTTSILIFDISGSNNIMENNLIDGGYWGIALLTKANSNIRETGNVIRGNTIRSAGSSIASWYHDELVVEDNRCIRSAVVDAAPSPIGVSVTYCYRFTMRRNIVLGYQDFNTFTSYKSTIEDNEFDHQPDPQGIMATAFIDSYDTTFFNRNIFRNYQQVTLSTHNYEYVEATKNTVGASFHIENYGRSNGNPYGSHAVISNNYILNSSVNSDDHGLRVYQSVNPVTNPAELYVFNNVIICSSLTNVTRSGLLLDVGAMKAGIYYNSVRNLTVDTGANTAALQVSGSTEVSDLRILNNIFSQEGGGAAFSVLQNTSAIVLDHNLFYSNGKRIGFYEGVELETLRDFQRLTGFSMHSLSGDPKFTSSTDLHVASTLVDGLGTPVGSIAVDFDNKLRDAGFPDAGAYEITPVIKNDLAIFSFDPLVSPKGTVVLKVNLINKGINSLKGNNITFSYSTDGGTTWSAPEAYTIANLTTPFAEENFSFQTQWTADELKKFNVCVRINSPGIPNDENPANDKFCGYVCIHRQGGLFTIGASGADFASIEAAITWLTTSPCGIFDPVIFNIKPGTYNGHFVLPAIEGTSEKTTITFQSSTGNPDDVIITFESEPTDTNNYTFKIAGTDYLTLRNLTIQNTGKYNVQNLQILDHSDYVTVTGCKIKAQAVPGVADSYGLYGNGIHKNLTLTNNEFTGGGYALYLFGNPGDRNKNTHNVVLKNVLKDALYYGMYLYTLNGVRVEYNHITMSNIDVKAVVDYGMYVLYSDSAIINANKILNAGVNGMYVSTSNNSVISNNCISSFKVYPEISYGMYLNYGTNVKVYHNSVDMNQPSLPNTEYPKYALYATGSMITTYKKFSIVNNIFSQSADGFVFYFRSKVIIDSADYNDYYTTGPILGRLGTTDISDIDVWKNKTGMEFHSMSVNPEFTSLTDLHTVKPQIDKAGTPLLEVLKDADGNLRSPKEPDIGAYEFILDPFDIAVTDINPKVLQPGEQSVTATFSNFGLNSLAGKQVNVSYSVDGGVSWSAPELFAPQNLIKTFDTEEFTFAAKWNVDDYTGYDIVVRIEPPGLQGDPFKDNDSLRIKACLLLPAGTYTIGKASSNFPTFKKLADLLDNLTCGIAGPVVFEVEAGTYNEQWTIPFVNGSSEMNTITFRSGTGKAADVVIKGGNNKTNDHHALRLLNAQNVILSNLTVENFSEEFATGVHITDGSGNITIENCVIRVSETGPSTTLYGVLLSDTSDIASQAAANNLKLLSNTISGGDAGIRLFGNPEKVSSGLTIRGNKITRAFSYGVLVGDFNIDLIENNEVELRDNEVFSFGLLLSNSLSDTRINANKLINGGMYLFNLRGINKVIVSNNMIAGESKGIAIGSGIVLEYLDKAGLYYNSVNYLNKKTESTHALYVKSGSKIDIRNNILTNAGSGYAYYVEDVSSVSASDYNDYYTAGSTLAYWNEDRKNLDELRNANQTDVNSIDTKPDFVSATDLHTFSSIVNGKGIPVIDVITDFDGQQRSDTKPDIGCDEFARGTDGGVIAIISPADNVKVDEVQAVEVKVSNYGNDVISNFPLTLTINGAEVAVETFAQTLNVGASATHLFSYQWTPASQGSYAICAGASVPGDVDVANDTFCKEVKAGAVGITEAGIEELSVWPNPASDKLNIRFIGKGQTTRMPDGQVNSYSVSIINLLGNRVAEFGLESPEMSYDVSRLSPGVYLLAITKNSGPGYRQIVVKL